jgi:UDP-N-acetylmuramyl pentapeptide synthase
MSDANIHWFENTAGAITYLTQQLGSGDVALVKGSHGMHMELIVAALETTS